MIITESDVLSEATPIEIIEEAFRTWKYPWQLDATQANPATPPIDAVDFFSLCDDLAGNPHDLRGSGKGVSYQELSTSTQFEMAIEACQAALAQHPKELRLQYQLARALEFKDPATAMNMQRDLIRQNYPAAFDNLGWLIIRRQKYADDNKYAQAVKSTIPLFQKRR
jgi:hypothetical protein